MDLGLYLTFPRQQQGQLGLSAFWHEPPLFRPGVTGLAPLAPQGEEPLDFRWRRCPGALSENPWPCWVFLKVLFVANSGGGEGVPRLKTRSPKTNRG